MKMTYEEWVAKFKPRTNKFVEPTEGDFNNTLYAPYGAQHDLVLSTEVEYLWTLTADGKQIITGFRCDERKGCFITNVRWNTGAETAATIVELEEEQDITESIAFSFTEEEEKEREELASMLSTVCHVSCPICDQEDITDGPWEDTDYEVITRTRKCNTCGARWHDIYTFSHNEDIDWNKIQEKKQFWI